MAIRQPSDAVLCQCVERFFRQAGIDRELKIQRVTRAHVRPVFREQAVELGEIACHGHAVEIVLDGRDSASPSPLADRLRQATVQFEVIDRFAERRHGSIQHLQVRRPRPEHEVLALVVVRNRQDVVGVHRRHAHVRPARDDVIEFLEILLAPTRTRSSPVGRVRPDEKAHFPRRLPVIREPALFNRCLEVLIEMVGELGAITFAIQILAAGVRVVPARQRRSPERGRQPVKNESHLIIGPGHIHELEAAARFAQVAGNRQQQQKRALQQVAMQPLGYPESGEDHGRPGVRDLSRDLPYHVGMHSRDFGCTLRRKPGRMLFDELKHRCDFNRAGRGGDRPASLQRRLQRSEREAGRRFGLRRPGHGDRKAGARRLG